MQKKYTRKLLGTSVLAVFIISLSFFGVSYAQAQYYEVKKTSVFDGVVTAKKGKTITVLVSRNKSVVVTVNNSTVFPKKQSLADIDIRDTVNVVAQTKNGNTIAKVIKINNQTGYGHPGNRFHFFKFKFVRKSDKDHTCSFRDENNREYTFRFSASTKFSNYDFKNFEEGDEFEIEASESNGEFHADNFKLERKHSRK